MTNGPNESSESHELLENPYPKGSARWKLKKRQLDKKRKAEAERRKANPPQKEDKSKRRKAIDDYLDSTE